MKIKFGAIVTDGRGKIGGHVASKNRAGAYLRTKVTPSNPNTTAQSTARAIFGSLSQGWSSLTDIERNAWNGAVSDWAKTDIFGDAKNPSGLNLYVKLNANISSIGGALLTTPPLKIEVPNTIAESASFVVSTGILTITYSDLLVSGNAVLVRATPQLSAGVSFVKSELRVIGHDVITLGVVTLLGNYADKYGYPAVGANVYCSVQFVLANGQKSVEQKLKVDVVA
jgi:hypothetical protein